MDKVLSDAAIDAQVDEIMRDPRNHIFCECQPILMFCGVKCEVTPGGDVHDMPDGDECPDCYLVWLGGYCPWCGNYWTEEDYKNRWK